jgi:hypothetical protein
MLNFCSERSGSVVAVVARGSAASALIIAALFAGACSGSPAGPGVLSSERRVQDGGAGGSLCPIGTCPGFEGRVEITAGNSSLSGQTTGVDEGGPTAFRFTSHLSGTGRFQAGYIDVQVNGDSALVNNLWFSRGTQTYQDKGKTLPATVVQGEKCTLERGEPGVLIETTIQANFQNFGNTTIVESHCIAAS